MYNQNNEAKVWILRDKRTFGIYGVFYNKENAEKMKMKMESRTVKLGIAEFRIWETMKK